MATDSDWNTALIAVQNETASWVGGVKAADFQATHHLTAEQAELAMRLMQDILNHVRRWEIPFDI